MANCAEVLIDEVESLEYFAEVLTDVVRSLECFAEVRGDEVGSLEYFAEMRVDGIGGYSITNPHLVILSGAKNLTTRNPFLHPLKLFLKLLILCIMLI